MITEKQKKLLDYIEDFTAEKGYCPSYDEMREYMGLKSKSGIYKLVHQLKERKQIKIIKNKRRAITVLSTRIARGN